MLSDRERKEAYDAIDHARTTRESLRRKSRPGDLTRNALVKSALARVKRAMKPVRSELHRTQYQAPSVYRQGLLYLSSDLQKERRKLWKFLQPSKRSDVHYTKTRFQRELAENQRRADRTVITE